MTAASKSTNKRACNNALFRIKERAGDTVVLCILLGGVLLFILWPMLCIALRSFRAADGGFTLEAYSNVLSKYGTSMRNSVVVGICTAVCQPYYRFPPRLPAPRAVRGDARCA